MKNHLSIFLFFIGFAAMAQPTDNPYRARFDAEMPSAPYHWTDSLPWNKVVNIQNYSNLVRKVRDFSSNFEDDSLNDWLFAFRAAQNAAVGLGGGVVYFPSLPFRVVIPGTDSSYYFSDDLMLKSDIILRGPTPAALDARQNTFCPPAFLEFPKYIYRGDVSINTPNSTAFKQIAIDTNGITGQGKPGFRNIALVYLDINRGRIAAFPTFKEVRQSPTVILFVANEKPRNFLVLGVRSNNVAIPDRDIPAEIISSGSENWHRWPYRLAANIDLYVSANAIVAGCRLNDYQNNTNTNRLIQSDDFAQSGYKPKPANATTPPCSPTPEQAKFDYNRHYGIIINRLKNIAYSAAVGFVNNATPSQEPELYAPGNLVLDNWIFKTSRAAIQAAGYGLIIKGNVTKDLQIKEASISPGGVNCLLSQFGAATPPTFENRGIDFSGWDVTIQNNQTEVFRTKLLPSNAFSTDGEGWYYQGISAGTARNILVSQNTFSGNEAGLCVALGSSNKKGFNGFTNTKSLQNIKVTNNDFGGIPFRIQAQGATTHTIQGLTVSGNTNVHSIEVKADGCGDSARVFNNSKIATPVNACGVPDLNIDCFTSINSNLSLRNENSNTGFSTYPNNPGGDDRSGCANVCPQGGPACGFPAITISDPTGNDCYAFGQQIPSVTVDYVFGAPANCAPDSIVLMRGPGIKVEKISQGFTPGSGQQFFTSYSAPVQDGSENIYAIIYKDAFFAQSPSKNIRICVSVAPSVISQDQIKMYPNPAGKSLNLAMKGISGESQYGIFDLTGRKLLGGKVDNSIISNLDVSQLAKGTYLVRFNINKQNVTKKLIID